MKRGDVYWVDFDPSVGGEIQKVRPAVLVSNTIANTNLNRVLVVPLSSQVGRFYPGETLVRLRGQPSKAMADQLTTVSKLRIQSRIGALSPSDLALVYRTILLQLGLEGPK